MSRSSEPRPHDVLIIGAGAAGLAAAAELARRERSALVLEARDRIGGRCWTRSEPGLDVPIEFGAEFIHGRPEPTINLMQQARIGAIERTGSAWFLQRARLRPRTGVLDEIRQAMEKAGAPQTDLTFETYLARHLRQLSPQARAFAIRRVEGYEAADPTRASAKEIVQSWIGEGGDNDVSFRPAGGYGALMSTMASGLNGSTVAMQLQTVVEAINWKRGSVQVEGTCLGKPYTMSARRAIVTLPLGVLKTPQGLPGAVRFAPVLTEKKPALKGLASGPVLKVLLRFRSTFWERVDHGRYRDAAFLQSHESPFPTFWTALPARVPLLVAWAGGPRAAAMADDDTTTVVDRAVESLRSLFGGEVDVDGQLLAAHLHDWQRDPFARGAYSYVTVGGSRARKALAAPVADTLYFAGEASDHEGEAATVAGALRSGLRAAREVLRAR